jgi:WD40 repeat protein/serine/threonine protein kinase
MTPERWQLVKAIFDQAVEREPASRAAFIHERCGNDEELQREVESLLASDQETGSLLENPLIGQATAASLFPAPPLADGDSFGPYVPVRVLGEGGMGTVYLARQQQPIRREVALKVVKLGMDSRQVLERFEIERQALALMDYPNVARVLDAGTSQRGRPYFVMEYVDGVPITQYCDRHALSTRERLQLFIPVCNALQHAHKKGIIHRDVKPSNILVTEVDGKPVPKVIDFGIARATEQRTAEFEAFTLAGQIIGTPEYMSPEQAGLGSRDIDTGTDVYSLGVVLYELLVGALPLDMKALRKIAFAEVLRAIRETPVPKPTARITQMGADAEGMARHRSTDPGQLKRDLSGDLDWIVMKAIDKDRQIRYGSAFEFGADIERFLKSEPVLAGPPGAVYRMRKFAVRHKRPVAAAAAVVLALVAGIIATTWQAHVAGQQRRAAIGERAEAEKQRGRAEQEALETAKQRDAAQSATKLAVEEKSKAERASTVAEQQKSLAERESGRANESSRLALARQLAAQASLLVQESPVNNSLSALLSIESMLRQPSLQGNQVLNRLLGVMPKHGLLIDHAGAGDLTFSHDGRLIATFGDDYTPRIFDTTTGSEVSHLAQSGQVLDARFSPNDRWIATGSDHGTARVSEVATGKEISRLVHGGSVSSVRFSPDGRWVATASSDHTARVFEAATGKEISRVVHDGPVLSVAFSPDGRWVASAGGNAVRVFEAASGKQTSPATIPRVVEIVFSLDGRRIVAGSGPRVNVLESVFVLEAATGREISHRDLLGPFVLASLGLGGRWVATAAGDNIVRVVDVDTGNEVSRYGHGDMVQAVVFSPNGRWLATASADKISRVFEVATGREVADFPVAATRLAFSPDDRWIATTAKEPGWDHTAARVFELAAGKEITPLGESSRIYATAFSSNGLWFATGSDDNFARVFDASTGKQIASVKHEGPVRAVALSSDGRWIATATRDKSARIFEVATNSEVSRLTYEGDVGKVVFSPDGRWIATVCSVITPNGEGMQIPEAFAEAFGTFPAQVQEAVTGAKVSDLAGPGFGFALAFSPNGRWIADRTRVFEAATGRIVSTAELDDRNLTIGELRSVSSSGSTVGLTFSPDSQLVARGYTGNTARVFEAATGTELLSLAHQGIVSAVAFSPDGRWLATGSYDKTARVFEVATGKEVSRFPHQGPVAAVAFSPDGRSLYSASTAISLTGDSTAGRGLLLDRHIVNTDDLIQETCSRLTSNLTPAQWKQHLGDEPYHRTCPNLPDPPKPPAGK